MTGRVQYVNAGHCPPLLKMSNGYEYVNVVRNMILGINSKYEYKSGELILNHNDRLFLYTDGVTEAQAENSKMFGEERLLKALNKKEISLTETLPYVHKQIKLFVKKAAQSDDITMLALEFHQTFA